MRSLVEKKDLKYPASIMLPLIRPVLFFVLTAALPETISKYLHSKQQEDICPYLQL